MVTKPVWAATATVGPERPQGGRRKKAPDNAKTQDVRNDGQKAKTASKPRPRRPKSKETKAQKAKTKDDKAQRAKMKESSHPKAKFRARTGQSKNPWV